MERDRADNAQLESLSYAGWEEYYQQAGPDGAWDEKPAASVSAFISRFSHVDPTNLHVADFGCGDGRNLWPWLQRRARVTAVDIAPTALRRIADACIAAKCASPTLVNAAIERMPLADAQFDVAQCIDALPQVPDMGAALAEMARTLRPQAEILFNVFTPGDCAFGEGRAVGKNAFVYKDTFFRFLDEAAVLELLPTHLSVVHMETCTWDDPPHIPFRPYPHRHEAIFLVCRRDA